MLNFWIRRLHVIGFHHYVAYLNERVTLWLQGADGIRAPFSNCNISEVIRSIVANLFWHSSVTDCALMSCKIRSPRRSSTSKSVEGVWTLLFVRAGRLSKAILKCFHIRYDQHDESCRTSGSVWKIPVLILRLHQKAKVKNNSLTTSFHQVHCPQQWMWRQAFPVLSWGHPTWQSRVLREIAKP